MAKKQDKTERIKELRKIFLERQERKSKTRIISVSDAAPDLSVVIDKAYEDEAYREGFNKTAREMKKNPFETQGEGVEQTKEILEEIVEGEMSEAREDEFPLQMKRTVGEEVETPEEIEAKIIERDVHEKYGKLTEILDETSGLIDNGTPGGNFRKAIFNEEGKEQFPDIEALTKGIKESAEKAGIKRERPNIEQIGNEAVAVGGFFDDGGRYTQKKFKDMTRPYSMNSIHITPSVGLKSYIPEPKLTPEEQEALSVRYGVAELKERLRNIMLGYRVDEYSAIPEMDSRQAMLKASERMILAVNDLTSTSSLFQAINSSVVEERVWAQRAMVEVFEEAANEYEYHTNNLIDELDPAVLAKKAKDRAEYSKEMRAMGDQGIKTTTDPSNMFALFVLLNFCPVFAVALLVPLLLPNLLSWGADVMSERAAFDSKNAESLRIQEKSSTSAAKIMGNMIVGKVVPALACNVSPEEMSRLVESTKNEMRGFGIELQGKLAKLFTEVVEKTKDKSGIILPGSTAAATLENGLKSLAGTAIHGMLEITEDGDVGEITRRLNAVREVAALTAHSSALQLKIDGNGYSTITNYNEDGKLHSPFEVESIMGKALSEGMTEDSKNYGTNIQVIQSVLLSQNNNVLNQLEEEIEGNLDGASKNKMASAIDILKERGAATRDFLGVQSVFEDAVKPITLEEQKDIDKLSAEKILRLGAEGQGFAGDAVAGMMRLKKVDGKINPDSFFHYTRYGFSRNEQGIRVGRNVDIKPPTVFSALLAIEEANHSFYGRKEMLEKNIEEKKQAFIDWNAFTDDVDRLLGGKEGGKVFDNILTKKSLEPFPDVNDVRQIQNAVKNILNKYEPGKSQGNEIEGKFLGPSGQKEVTRFLTNLKQSAERLEKSIDGDEDDAQRYMELVQEYNGAKKELSEYFATESKNFRDQLNSAVTEYARTKAKSDDVINASIADMSMRIVPQEAWGALSSLDDKYTTALERMENKCSRLKPGEKREGADELLASVRKACGKMHEANKLSIAAFVLSKQVNSERRARILRGEQKPSLGETIGLSTLTGLISRAAVLEIEASPVLAKAASEVSVSSNDPVSVLAASHINETARITGGGLLLGGRIREAEKTLGFNVMEIISSHCDGVPECAGKPNPLSDILKSGRLDGAIYYSEENGRPWNEKIQEIISVKDRNIWGNRKNFEETAYEVSRLRRMQKDMDYFANNSFRGFISNPPREPGLNMENKNDQKLRKEQCLKSWDRDSSLLVSWFNATAMSGLLGQLTGAHLDADVRQAEKNMAERGVSFKEAYDTSGGRGVLSNIVSLFGNGLGNSIFGAGRSSDSESRDSNTEPDNSEKLSFDEPGL